jgi:orotate phosphoribosyltransferase
MTMSYPDVRTAIRNAFIRLIEEEKITMMYRRHRDRRNPHAMLVAQKLEAPMIYIRSEPKGHGKENLVEGKLENGQKVLVIEDLISTGGSSLKAIEGVRQQEVWSNTALPSRLTR